MAQLSNRIQVAAEGQVWGKWAPIIAAAAMLEADLARLRAERDALLDVLNRIRDNCDHVPVVVTTYNRDKTIKERRGVCEKCKSLLWYEVSDD